MASTRPPAAGPFREFLEAVKKAEADAAVGAAGTVGGGHPAGGRAPPLPIRRQRD